jgi:hypothetical protein
MMLADHFHSSVILPEHLPQTRSSILFLCSKTTLAVSRYRVLMMDACFDCRWLRRPNAFSETWDESLASKVTITGNDYEREGSDIFKSVYPAKVDPGVTYLQWMRQSLGDGQRQDSNRYCLDFVVRRQGSVQDLSKVSLDDRRSNTIRGARQGISEALSWR